MEPLPWPRLLLLAAEAADAAEATEARRTASWAARACSLASSAEWESDATLPPLPLPPSGTTALGSSGRTKPQCCPTHSAVVVALTCLCTARIAAPAAQESRQRGSGAAPARRLPACTPTPRFSLIAPCSSSTQPAGLPPAAAFAWKERIIWFTLFGVAMTAAAATTRHARTWLSEILVNWALAAVLCGRGRVESG